MAVTARALRVERRAWGAGGIAYRLAGLTIACAGPALFWAAVLAAYNVAADAHVAITSIAAFGAAVAVFLAAVCAPLMLKD